MKLDWRSLLISLIGLGMVGGVLALPAFYLIGNWTAPESPVAVTTPLPPLVRAAIWARAQGAGEPHVQPVTPWGLFGFIACGVAAEPLPKEEATQQRAHCVEDQAGLLLAGQVARLYTISLIGTPRFPLSQLAMMARLTREWDADALLSTVAAKSQFGQQKWIGIDQASQAFFRKGPPELNAAEAALLSVQLPNPAAQDPWCHPDRARSERDVVLAKMKKNGALAPDVFESGINAPLSVVAGDCAPR